MAFSASTCLTDLSGANLTDPIKFYSDVNNFLFEFNSANLSQLTGTSCPFILTNIPDGTKVVKIVSENNYCANIDVEKLDWNGKIAAITRARIVWRKNVVFWKAVPITPFKIGKGTNHSSFLFLPFFKKNFDRFAVIRPFQIKKIK